MKTRILGSSGLEVSAIGLGCWGMSGAYGAADDRQSITTIHHALDQGINFIDTADIYGNGHNEMLVGKALRKVRHKVVLATKFGFIGDEKGRLKVNGRPEYLMKACDESLRRLGTDYIDLYYLHRLDKNVPVGETVGAMSRLVEKGKIRCIGLSEVSEDSLQKAVMVYPVAALQSEYSLNTRDIEKEIIPTCRNNNIAIVPFSPLGRALLTGSIKKIEDLAVNDFRKDLPRFQDDNLKKNLEMLSVIEEIARDKNITNAQLALAWLLQRGEDIIPIPGMKSKKYIEENISSVDVTLSKKNMESLDSVSRKISGERYSEKSRQFLEK